MLKGKLLSLVLFIACTCVLLFRHSCDYEHESMSVYSAGFNPLLSSLRSRFCDVMGNRDVASNNFIGTLNRQEFRIHVADVPRAIFGVDGRVGFNTERPLKQLDVRFRDETRYHASKWEIDGMLLYNDWKTTSLGHASALTFAAIGGRGAHLARAIVSGECTDADRMDLVFQNEYEGPDHMRESMRITSDGYVGIGTNPTTPKRVLHTVGTIRLESLSRGQGDYLVIDENGDVHRSGAAPRERRTDRMENDDALRQLERKVQSLEGEVDRLRRNYERRNR